jgi:hypothetical protein
MARLDVDAQSLGHSEILAVLVDRASSTHAVVADAYRGGAQSAMRGWGRLATAWRVAYNDAMGIALG